MTENKVSKLTFLLLMMQHPVEHVTSKYFIKVNVFM